jgi:hypothetical protein
MRSVFAIGVEFINEEEKVVGSLLTDIKGAAYVFPSRAAAEVEIVRRRNENKGQIGVEEMEVLKAIRPMVTRVFEPLGICFKPIKADYVIVSIPNFLIGKAQS